MFQINYKTKVDTMKRYIIILLAGLIFSSCEDFLEEKSQDQIIPHKIKDISELIYGELILRHISTQDKFDAMSDDLTSRWYQQPYGNTDIYRKDLYQYFTWQKDLEIGMDGNESPDEFYGKLYADIVLCNAIEDIIPEMVGSEEERLNALAEVCFFRALSYFDLANIYSTPYVDEEQSKVTPCVPVNKAKGVEMNTYIRSTQREVFDIIEENIEKAVSYFDQAQIPTSIYRPNYDAACILATRIFLYEKKYEKVIEYANNIEGMTSLYNMADYAGTYGLVNDINSNEFDKSGYVHFINKRNTEIKFTYNGGYNLSSISPLGGNVSGYYFPSDALLNGYEPEDLRRQVYFDNAGNITKMSYLIREVHTSNFRTTEALLNRAEAYAHLDEAKAKTDLEFLRNNRFSSSDAAKVTGDILEAVKLERRRELCFEGIRWMDLRRWGMPEIKHEFFLDDNARKEIYTLSAEDAGYTFSLPDAVMDLNAQIKQHIRPERIPVIVDL